MLSTDETRRISSLGVLGVLVWEKEATSSVFVTAVLMEVLDPAVAAVMNSVVDARVAIIMCILVTESVAMSGVEAEMVVEQR